MLIAVINDCDVVIRSIQFGLRHLTLVVAWFLSRRQQASLPSIAVFMSISLEFMSVFEVAFTVDGAIDWRAAPWRTRSLRATLQSVRDGRNQDNVVWCTSQVDLVDDGPSDSSCTHRRSAQTCSNGHNQVNNEALLEHLRWRKLVKRGRATGGGRSHYWPIGWDSRWATASSGPPMDTRPLIDFLLNQFTTVSNFIVFMTNLKFSYSSCTHFYQLQRTNYLISYEINRSQIPPPLSAWIPGALYSNRRKLLWYNFKPMALSIM